ncbi:MAG: YciI family protein, partial [Pseudomonadota bacterium]
MPFSILGRDAPGSDAPRRQHLDAHLAHVERVIDRILVAGPLRDPSSGATVGSLLVVDVPDAAAARAFIEADPYYAAGVW